MTDKRKDSAYQEKEAKANKRYKAEKRKDLEYRRKERVRDKLLDEPAEELVGGPGRKQVREGGTLTESKKPARSEHFKLSIRTSATTHGLIALAVREMAKAAA